MTATSPVVIITLNSSSICLSCHPSHPTRLIRAMTEASINTICAQCSLMTVHCCDVLDDEAARPVSSRARATGVLQTYSRRNRPSYLTDSLSSKEPGSQQGTCARCSLPRDHTACFYAPSHALRITSTAMSPNLNGCYSIRGQLADTYITDTAS